MPNSDFSDSSATSQANPFEAPAAIEGEVEAILQEETKEVAPLSKLFWKWAFVCGVSATPSFIVAMSFEPDWPAKAGGMVTGILLFVLSYVYAERTKFIQDLLKKPFVRTTAWIGYGTRIFITVVFPIGFFVDMFCGMLSVGLSQAITGMVFGFDSGDGGSSSASSISSFSWFFLTTVIQGMVLNIVLFAYMLLVWLIGFGIYSIRNRPKL